MGQGSLERYHEAFSGDRDLMAYEQLLTSYLDQPQSEFAPQAIPTLATATSKSQQ